MDTHKSSNSGLIVVVGIIGIIALIVAWLAFNRSGENLTSEVANEAAELVEETEDNFNQLGNEIDMAATNFTTNAELALAEAEARIDLLAMQAELEAEENYEEAVAQVQSVRSNLADTYQNAEAAAVENWQDLDRELETLEQSLRSESADALEVLGGLVLMLEADVRTEDQ